MTTTKQTKQRKLPASYMLLAITGIAVALIWFVAEPRMRAQAERQAEIAALAANERATELEVSQEEAEQVERTKAMEIRAANDKLRSEATRAQISTAVQLCRDRILEITKDGYEPYFGLYKWTDLRRMTDLASLLGVKLTRPSAQLDDYSFDPLEYNVDRLMDPDFSSLSTIYFAVEDAEDGFNGPRQYASVWSCQLAGITPSEPREGERYYLY